MLLTRETDLRENLRFMHYPTHPFTSNEIHSSALHIVNTSSSGGTSHEVSSTSGVLWRNEAKVSLKFDLSSNLFPFCFCLVNSQTLPCGTEAPLQTADSCFKCFAAQMLQSDICIVQDSRILYLKCQQTHKVLKPPELHLKRCLIIEFTAKCSFLLILKENMK